MNNPLVSCPYNPAHKVLRSRIQGHIVKCKKNYPQLEICPYNATHRFPKSEIMQHVTNCPNKVVQYENIAQDKVVTCMLKYDNQPCPNQMDPNDECWD